jgi:glycine cleavage system aminomethyltransferase T/glycine/D-amino acid oxidase-like deaminating enzyme
MNKANVVIIGAGIVGSSIAYHLAKLGWKDIVLLDMGDPIENPGSTSHAPGGVVAMSHSKLLTQMAQYGSNLYRSLQPYAPYHRKTYNWVGGLDLAINQRRWDDFKRLHAEGKSFHAETELLSAEEATAKHPLLNPKAFVGAIFVKNSALVSGAAVSGALQRDAAALAEGRVQVLGFTEVTDVEVKRGRVAAVLTQNPAAPRIDCEYVVLATNIWGPVLGDKLGVPIPLLAYQHQYAITKPLPELQGFDPAQLADEVIYPTVREVESQFYLRQHHQQMGIGNYWHGVHQVKPHAVGASAMREFTPADMDKTWHALQSLMPAVTKPGREFTRAFNGMFAFPVDGYPILGEASVRGLWVACGSWLTHAGGVGKCLAEWMTTGSAEWDMRQVHAHRFHKFQNAQAYLSEICDKNYEEIYAIVHPRQPLSRPRNVRVTPFHERFVAQNTSFTTFAGYEAPNWVEQNARLLEKYEDQIPERSGWGAEYWSRIQGAEHLECRNNAALFDLSTLSVFEVSGPGAAQYVDYLCSNKCDVKVGRVVYTCWLTPTGGVRRDLAVARIEQDKFWMFVGEGTRPMDWHWVNQFKPAANDGAVTLTDISDSYAALGVWGPNARKILQKVTSSDMGNAAFPYFTSQWIEIGAANVYALRVSYAGELGWELHMPVDQAPQVFDALWQAGREFGMIASGFGAFDSLRLEKGYRGWGSDVHTEYSPYEAGLGWTVKTDKVDASGHPIDFIGKAACIALKDKPLKKKLCMMALEDRKAVLFGYEPIFGTNGHTSEHAVGYVTSANYGYSVGKFLAFGYLPIELTQVGTPVEIEYFGERFKARVTDDPPFDAQMARLKG